MTRKDYKLIAEAVNATIREGEGNIHYLIGRLGQSLKEENPRFDMGRFEAACKAVQR